MPPCRDLGRLFVARNPELEGEIFKDISATSHLVHSFDEIVQLCPNTLVIALVVQPSSIVST